ncbi:MAG TPA: hypothetical protein VFF67_06695 [Thermoplasmata archaeon]|nr:hypothetical protein [Thermoplasmata archaeon]
MSAGRPRETADDEAPAPCAVPGCGGEAIRSLARVEVRKIFPEVGESGRRAPLCREHYRAWKKATKQARLYDRLGR